MKPPHILSDMGVFFMKKAVTFAILFLPALCFLLAVRAEAAEFSVLLDAGHGGEDCGAIGITGVYEKDLNFKMCQRVGALLREAGISVHYTRETDRLLYTEEQNVKGQRKKYDLRNRLTAFHEGDDDLLISIHMNAFGEEKYRGFQVYYENRHPQSQRLAEELQASVVKALQPWNKREAKAGDSNIYLLAEAKKPAILIECGFVSNREECEKLVEEDYQKQLSFLIFCAIIDYRDFLTQG